MGLIRGAAEFAVKRMHSKVLVERFLPESRDRRAFSVTWCTWWEKRFGVELGMNLQQYCKANSINSGDGQ